MELTFAIELLIVILAAFIGGSLAKVLKLQPIIGYILAGTIFGAIFPFWVIGAQKLAEIGLILLLFSVGIELSLSRLTRVFRIATFGALIQIILVTAIGFFFLSLLGLNSQTSLILAIGFSLSSTAIIVKILSDRGEIDTAHGEIMVGWSLVQDLVAIPIMVILPVMAKGGNFGSFGLVLVQSLVVVGIALFLGRKVAPYFIHKIASLNSRELLVLSAISFAIGISALSSLFGISPALGAFLAGVVISETQENHAIFAETRPLRDLFVAIFFVSLGFSAIPAVIFNNFPLILTLAVFFLVIKFFVVLFLSLALGHRGKTAISISLGLAQIGEFSFLIFSSANLLGLISNEITTIGIVTGLITLLATPFLFKSIVPIWRKIREVTSHWPTLAKYFTGWDKSGALETNEMSNHTIICGFGRVGGWVGKALDSLKVPYVVVDYNQGIVNKLKKGGTAVIYGDPTEPEVLEAAGLARAKAVVVAIPDRVAQEELITHIQTITPEVKIISRVHLDEDFEKLKLLKVDKIVQPEFEAAVAITRSILYSMGRGKEEIGRRIKSLRLARAMTKL